MGCVDMVISLYVQEPVRGWGYAHIDRYTAL